MVGASVWLQLPLQIRRGYFGKDDLNKKAFLHILHLHQGANRSVLPFSPRPINCNVVVVPPFLYRLWHRQFGLTFNDFVIFGIETCWASFPTFCFSCIQPRMQWLNLWGDIFCNQSKKCTQPLSHTKRV